MSLSFWSILVVILLLGVLVTIHELGHYWMARLLGIKAYEVSIFVGPKLIKWRHKDCDFSIRCIPFGAYVRFTDIDDNGDSVQGYEINQTLILSEINAAVQDLAGASLFNVNSSQVQYFQTFLCAHPFYDYVITYDGQYDYNLYYGYKLKTATADRIHIYRYNTGSYNYEYRIDFSSGQTVPSSNVYINSMEGQVLHDVQTQKFETVVMLSFAVMLVLWFFSKVIFR